MQAPIVVPSIVALQKGTALKKSYTRSQYPMMLVPVGADSGAGQFPTKVHSRNTSAATHPFHLALGKVVSMSFPYLSAFLFFVCLSGWHDCWHYHHSHTEEQSLFVSQS